MKVLHVIPSLSVEDGGPTFALISLVKALNDSEVSATIVTTLSPGANENDHGVCTQNARILYFRRSIRPYKIAWTIVPWLLRNIRNFDVVHVHAVFSFVSVVTAAVARSKRVPYVVRPLGVLNRWGMRNRRPLGKRISYALIESRILRSASTLHFTSSGEAEQAYEVDSDLAAVPSLILPLPIEVPEHAGEFLQRFPQISNLDWILFLSRFNQQKGLDLLVDAFARFHSTHPDCYLVVAGGGDPKYLRSLQKKCRIVGIQDRVLWPGYLTGREKWSALASAKLFVLPSYSESFGIAAAEALASGTASILSVGIPFAEEAARAGAAVAVACEAESVRDAIEQLLADPAKRKTLGENAKRYADKNFSPVAIATALAERYRSLLNRG